MPQKETPTFRKETQVKIDKDNLAALGKQVVEKSPAIMALIEWTKLKAEDNNKYIQGFLLSDRFTERACGALLGENRALTKSFKAFLKHAENAYKVSIGEKGKVINTNQNGIQEEKEEDNEEE